MPGWRVFSSRCEGLGCGADTGLPPVSGPGSVGALAGALRWDHSTPAHGAGQLARWDWLAGATLNAHPGEQRLVARPVVVDRHGRLLRCVGVGHGGDPAVAAMTAGVGVDA